MGVAASDHSRSSSSRRSLQELMKILMQDIPRYFLEYCASRKWELKEKMVLEGDESGMLWKVMMVLRRYKEKRRANTVRVRARLARGWKDFALQNKLNTGDNLLFTLVRLNRFVVKFFHPDGSQKKGWLCSNLQQPPAIHAHKLLLPCKNRAAEAANFKYIEHITSDGHEYVEILDSSSGSSSSSSSDEEEINEQVGVAVGLRVDNDASRDHLQSPAAVHRTNPSRLGAAADRELVIRAHQVIYTTKRPREVTDEERAKAIVAARACARSLPNISFMLIMRCSEVYYHFHLVGTQPLPLFPEEIIHNLEKIEREREREQYNTIRHNKHHLLSIVMDETTKFTSHTCHEPQLFA
jgi:hypothetical protein